MPKAPTERFSSRVEAYVKYRPHYPDAVLNLLDRECGLNGGSVVADVGAGTGISTELLLRSGATVHAVEPNARMREAAEAWLSGNPNFRSVSGTAEATTLAGESVDLIVAGQAFHWFELEPTRREFVRILKPDGWLALMWNDRRTTGTPFLKGYEQILREYTPEYLVVHHKQIDEEKLAGFFGRERMTTASFPNSQRLDFEGLWGRILSSSYAPEMGDANYEPTLAAVRNLFEREAVCETVELVYDTKVFYGRL